MKKVVAFVLAAAMSMSLVACGSSTASSAPAASAASQAASTPAADGKTVKIGMVTDVGGVNDKSFNQTSWEGLQALAAEDPSFEVNYLESHTDADYAANLEAFIDEDYDLIISVGYMLADATRAAAEANPDQKFAIIDDATCQDLPNVACLMFAQEQASYLVGVVAGMATKSNTVGYVQGMVSESMNKFGVGYIAGVLAANPDAKVLQFNANSFGDAAGGSAAATQMITSGADVIYHAAGGTGNGVIEACNTNGVFAIGVDTDQSPLAPDVVLTSAMKRVDIASQDVSKAVKADAFEAGVHLYDMSNGGVDIAPTQTLLTEDMIAAVEKAKASIQSGEIVVPTTGDELAEQVGSDVFELDN